MAFQKPLTCPKCFTDGKEIAFKAGYFYTKHNHEYRNPRYVCFNCGAKFSSHSDRANKGQKRPDINSEIFKWICSGATISRIAKNLSVNKITVMRKIKWLSEQARIAHGEAIARGDLTTSYIHFDEMEAYEHTPLKPLSVAIAVRVKTLQIVDARVATMNAKGHLVETSVQKYGRRQDTRIDACLEVMKTVKRVSRETLTITCDSKTNYPTLIKPILPYAKINAVLATKRKRGDKNEDPLFAVNSVCALLRQDLAVLARKTMSTLKKAETLQDLLNIYIAYNNEYDITSLAIKANIVEPPRKLKIKKKTV